jgi:hypothetical protein
MDRPKFLDHSEPNIVLRGGPLDGERMRVEYRVPIVRDVGDERCVYRPTGDLDTEYPTLAVYVIDHIEPV